MSQPPPPVADDVGDIALVIVGALLISLKGIFVKLIYAEGVSVEAALVLRAWISLPMVWLWALYRVGWPAIIGVPRNLIGGALLAGFACYYFGSWLDFVALDLIDASLERVLIFTYPVMIVMARGLVDRKWPGWRVSTAVMVTYCGIILAVGGLDLSLWQVNGFGAILVLASAASFAYYMIANERVARLTGSVVFIVFATSSASLFLSLHFAAFGDVSDFAISPLGWGLVIAMTLITNVLPLFMFSASIRRIGAQRAAILSSIGPPATIGFAMLLLGEQMRSIQLLGAGLIIVGILVLEMRRASTAVGVKSVI